MDMWGLPAHRSGVSLPSLIERTRLGLLEISPLRTRQAMKGKDTWRSDRPATSLWRS